MNFRSNDLVEYGHAKDDQGKPIVNYAVAYDCDNSLPLFYEDYPGSITDIAQLQVMFEKGKGIWIQECRLHS